VDQDQSIRFDNENKHFVVVYNIEDCKYIQETIHTKTMSESRVVFRENMHHWILQHIRGHQSVYEDPSFRSTLFLDGGPECPTLYFIHNVGQIMKSLSNRIDIVISSIPKNIFIEKVQKHLLPSSNNGDTLGKAPIGTMIRHTTMTRSYVDAIESCDLRRKVDVDLLFTMIECVPIYHIKRIYERSVVQYEEKHDNMHGDEGDDRVSMMGSSIMSGSETEVGYESCYESFGEMLAGWIGILSNRNETCYYRFMLWIDSVIRKEYSTPFPFGKYKGNALCDLPPTYVQWLLENDILQSDGMYQRVFDMQRMQDEHLHRSFMYSTNYREYSCLTKLFFRYFDRHRSSSIHQHLTLTMVPSISERPWVEFISEYTSDTMECTCSSFVSNRYPHRCCLTVLDTDASGNSNSKFKTLIPISWKGTLRAYHTECLLRSYHFIDRQYKYDFESGELKQPKGIFQKFDEQEQV
jgi:uncharacterized protein (DUF3820 family)